MQITSIKNCSLNRLTYFAVDTAPELILSVSCTCAPMVYDVNTVCNKPSLYLSVCHFCNSLISSLLDLLAAGLMLAGAVCWAKCYLVYFWYLAQNQHLSLKTHFITSLSLLSRLSCCMNVFRCSLYIIFIFWHNPVSIYGSWKIHGII